MHDSLNHLQKAYDLLNIVKQPSATHSAHGLVNILDDVIKHLMKCQSRLVLPSQLTLQALVGSGFTVSLSVKLKLVTMTMNLFLFMM